VGTKYGIESATSPKMQIFKQESTFRPLPTAVIYLRVGNVLINKGVIPPQAIHI
jgi:hypothetical protein